MRTSQTYFAAAVFQQDVDVFLVLEMVVKVHDVFMMQYSVQLDLSVNLAETNTKLEVFLFLFLSAASARTAAVTRLPSPVGEAWRRAHVG